MIHTNEQKKVNLVDIEHDLRILQARKNKMPVLLSLICDPYDVERRDGAKPKPKGLMKWLPEESSSEGNSYLRLILEIFRDYDQPFQILTKGGKLAATDFDLYRSNDSFGVTLTFDNDADSKKWEPGAALPGDRIAALEEAHNRGIRT
jgi:hypothetical protein